MKNENTSRRRRVFTYPIGTAKSNAGMPAAYRRTIRS